MEIRTVNIILVMALALSLALTVYAYKQVDESFQNLNEMISKSHVEHHEWLKERNLLEGHLKYENK